MKSRHVIWVFAAIGFHQVLLLAGAADRWCKPAFWPLIGLVFVYAAGKLAVIAYGFYLMYHEVRGELSAPR